MKCVKHTSFEFGCRRSAVSVARTILVVHISVLVEGAVVAESQDLRKDVFLSELATHPGDYGDEGLPWWAPVHSEGLLVQQEGLPQVALPWGHYHPLCQWEPRPGGLTLT